MLKLTVRSDNHGLAALGWQNAQLPSLTFFLPTCEHFIYLKLKVCRRHNVCWPFSFPELTVFDIERPWPDSKVFVSYVYLYESIWVRSKVKEND